MPRHATPLRATAPPPAAGDGQTGSESVRGRRASHLRDLAGLKRGAGKAAAARSPWRAGGRLGGLAHVIPSREYYRPQEHFHRRRPPSTDASERQAGGRWGGRCPMRLFYSLTVFYSRPNFLIPVEVMSMGKKIMLQLNITFTCKSNCIKSVQ